MKKIYKCAGVCLTAVLTASMVFAGCGSEETSVSRENDAVAVDTRQVEKGTLTLTNQFVGTVMPESSVYIIPMAQGTVTKTYFEVGDKVEAGDILFEIDDTAAQLQLKQAKLTYENTKSQVDGSLESAEDQVDTAITQLEAQRTGALAQLQGAQTQYFTLKDSVDQGEAALEMMKKQLAELDTMSSDEVIALAAKYLQSAVSSGSSVDLGSLLEGKIDLDDIINGSVPEETKDALAEELRPILKEMLTEQIAAAESSLKQARMGLNTAETTMNAALESFEIIEQTLYDTVHTDLTDSKAQAGNSLSLAKLAVEGAELSLSYYDVEAPISGTIISKTVSENAIATSTQPAYIIEGGDTMTVTFQVSERVRNTLEKGAELLVERGGTVYNGTITEIGNAVNSQTGLFQIKGTIQATSSELPTGVSVKLTVETYKAENAVIIPYDAVYFENSGAYVYVVKDGAAVKTPVTTGIFDEDSIEITDGLYLEDVLITSWSPRLMDGTKVAAAESLSKEEGGK